MNLLADILLLVFFASVLYAVVVPEITRSMPPARHRDCVRGASDPTTTGAPRVRGEGRVSPCASSPRFSDPFFWIGHGGSVKKWE